MKLALDKDFYYFKSLILQDVKCFQGEHTIHLTDEEGNPAKWTVILGNNNTGKTTVLRALRGMEVKKYKLGDDMYIQPANMRLRSNEYNKVCCSVGSGNKTFEVGFERCQNKFGDSFFRSMTPINIELDIWLIDYGTSKHSTNDILANKERLTQIELLSKYNGENSEIENWLFDLQLASLSGNQTASKFLQKIKKIFTDGLLPDITDFEFVTYEEKGKISNVILFHTDYGKIRLQELGYGYQASLSWIGDLLRKMFEKYPESENPAAEPAIVLVDEIDLHLHPEWQRKLIGYLDKHFPRTQFIVTSHSPLVVQSADGVNVVVLEKKNNHVTVAQQGFRNYQGWSVEEILSEIMLLDDRTHSDRYLKLMSDFENALNDENLQAAQAAYDSLDKILHPSSSARKVMRLQMSSIPV